MFEHNNDSFDTSATRFDEAGVRLKNCEEHVRMLEDKVCEGCNQLLGNIASSGVYRERFLALAQELPSISADVKHLTAQHTSNRDLLDGVRTTLTMDKTASPQRASAHTKKHETLLFDKALVEKELSKFRADMYVKCDQNEASLGEEVKPGSSFNIERVRLLAAESRLNRQVLFPEDRKRSKT